MSQYIVKIVRSAPGPLFYRSGGPLEPDPFKATRFGAFRDAAACVAAALSPGCGVPEPAEVHIVPAPPDRLWTPEEILAREGLGNSR